MHFQAIKLMEHNFIKKVICRVRLQCRRLSVFFPLVPSSNRTSSFPRYGSPTTFPKCLSDKRNTLPSQSIKTKLIK